MGWGRVVSEWDHTCSTVALGVRPAANGCSYAPGIDFDSLATSPGHDGPVCVGVTNPPGSGSVELALQILVIACMVSHAASQVLCPNGKVLGITKSKSVFGTSANDQVWAEILLQKA